jgi:hypothetical protein
MINYKIYNYCMVNRMRRERSAIIVFLDFSRNTRLHLGILLLKSGCKNTRIFFAKPHGY